MTQAERIQQSRETLKRYLPYGSTLVTINRKQGNSQAGKVTYFDYFKVNENGAIWLSGHIANVLALKFDEKHNGIRTMWSDYLSIVGQLSQELFDGDHEGLKVLKL